MRPDEKLMAPQSIIALITLAIVIMVLGIVAWRGNDELLGNVVSFILGGGFVAVTQYYFGSAHGSQQKDSTIAALAVTNQQRPPAP